MRLTLIVLFGLGLAGCASTPAYNPMQVATQQELLLNQGGFKAIHDGMTITEVHKLMGDALVIGYKAESDTYKPLTIANPYKTEAIAGTTYVVDYYIASINQPDNIVSDNELLPLVFKEGKLIGRGWDLLNSLRPAKTAA